MNIALSLLKQSDCAAACFEGASFPEPAPELGSCGSCQLFGAGSAGIPLPEGVGPAKRRGIWNEPLGTSCGLKCPWVSLAEAGPG